MCFDGYFRAKTEIDEDTNNDLDIFDMIATAIYYRISYQDLGKMSYVMLANIVDALAPSKHKPTQEEIDLIT